LHFLKATSRYLAPKPVPTFIAIDNGSPTQAGRFADAVHADITAGQQGGDHAAADSSADSARSINARSASDRAGIFGCARRQFSSRS